MTELSASEINNHNARYAPFWRRTDEASGMVRFVCNPEDRIGQKHEFEFDFEIHPDELRKGLADPARQRDLLGSVINMCKPLILEAKPWMCMACDRRASEMVNTPRLDTEIPQPMPVITDLLPLFICAAPACEAEARRITERIIKDMSRDARASGVPDLRQEQAYICKYCAAVKPCACGKLLQCGKCRAAWHTHEY